MFQGVRAVGNMIECWGVGAAWSCRKIGLAHNCPELLLIGHGIIACPESFLPGSKITSEYKASVCLRQADIHYCMRQFMDADILA